MKVKAIAFAICLTRWLCLLEVDLNDVNLSSAKFVIHLIVFYSRLKSI